MIAADVDARYENNKYEGRAIWTRKKTWVKLGNRRPFSLTAVQVRSNGGAKISVRNEV